MIRLFHVSDVHFGAEDPAALAWFAERVAVEKPDAVIMTGDLTMRATKREFQAGGAWLQSLGVPVTVEVGNHDIPYYWDPFRRLFAPYQRYAAVEKMIERVCDCVIDDRLREATSMVLLETSSKLRSIFLLTRM